MEANINEIEVNGQVYVKRGSEQVKAESLDGKEYCIVRTYSAGVFAGYIDRKSIDNRSATIYNSRRLWRWSGAASLSQMSVEGTSNPSGCKFPCKVPECYLTEIIEVIPCSAKSKASIEGVNVWSC
jgi:hypothetical protein